MEHYTAGIIMNDAKHTFLLKKYLQKFSKKIFIVIETNKAIDDFLLVKKIKPDIIFIEAFIEGKSAFTFLEMYKEVTLQIIIISANTDYAIKAIKHQVSDYILKPFNESQIVNSLKHVITNIKNQKSNQIDSQNFFLKNQELIYLPIKHTTKIELLFVEDIMYCEAMAKHTIFHLLDGKQCKSNKNLKTYEELLKKNPFIRIHRKYLVNLNMVIKVDITQKNICELLNGKLLPISKRKKMIISNLLNL